MRTVYLDANVVLDHVLSRKPFDHDADQIVELAHRGNIKAVTDTHTIVFAFFHLRKALKNTAECKTKLLALMTSLSFVSLSEANLKAALSTTYPADLEDAAQVNMAMEAKADVFITRNLKDFRNISLRAMSPQDFLLDWSNALP